MKKILFVISFLVLALCSCTKEKEYYVTYMVDDSLYEKCLVEEGANLEFPEDPIKDGYVFLGWYFLDEKWEESNIVSSSLTLNAKFRECLYYSVTFNINGEVYKEVSVVENSNLEYIEAPTLMGLEFDGWYINEEKFDFSTKITSSIVLEAKYVYLGDGTHAHVFNDYVCYICGSGYNKLLFDTYGNDQMIYTNDISNPYDIDLNQYGSDVLVMFYEEEDFVDPYTNITREEFYENYSPASSYLDAKYRTSHGFMSGDITPQSHLPKTNSFDVKCSTATYILDTEGNYIAYVINNLTASDSIIYYGGAYTSLNEVAAYLLAFGEVPPNSNFDKGSSGRKKSVSIWGEYGRCNIGEFYGNTGNYPYEPNLPGNDYLYYVETDFGTIGGYSNVSPSKTYNQTIYNDGSKITRGAARFCFVYEDDKNIDNRYVFYTYNHYNDFQEYLNYYDGFGTRFGNESAGNQYCASSSDYYNHSKYPITSYKECNKESRYNIIN